MEAATAASLGLLVLLTVLGFAAGAGGSLGQLMRRRSSVLGDEFVVSAVVLASGASDVGDWMVACGEPVVACRVGVRLNMVVRERGEHGPVG
jgi:hypothetical protein